MCRTGMRYSAWSVLAVLVFSGSLEAQESTLRLKGLNGEAVVPRARSTTLKRLVPGRSHVLMQFSEVPSKEQVEALKRRGIRPLQYVPERGLMVSMDDSARLDNLNLRWSGRLTRKAKLSSLVYGGNHLPSEDFFVVEFFPDVQAEVAWALADAEGFAIYHHLDIMPNHLLIRGARQNLPALADWDEVAYIFPAATDLVEGRHVQACPGALTALGPIGQYSGRISEGWDGPGLQSANLGYCFERLTAKLPQDKASAVIRRAMEEWAKYADITFAATANPASLRTLNFLFARGDHGDGYPFDGAGRVLAHTFFPAPPNPEPIAGDVHFDEDEEWVVDPDSNLYSVDLFTVALHEIGHALGLPHSDVPGSVMYPYYHRMTGLTATDIRDIQQLYASTRSGASKDSGDGAVEPLVIRIEQPATFPLFTYEPGLSISGSVVGGSGDVRVSWTTDRAIGGVAAGGRNWSIAWAPLQVGDNTLTIQAIDADQRQDLRSVVVTRQPVQETLVVRIATPTTGSSYVTAYPSVTLAGTVSSTSSITRVSWSNSAGGAGLASGTTVWTAGPITVSIGVNRITITAQAANGATASASLDVTFTGKVTDTVAPYLTILSPASSIVLTNSSSISLRGTASDNLGVTEVNWTTSTGKNGIASGTTSWSTGEIPLLVGTNRITVRALDAAGNVGWRSISVERK